MIRAKNLSKFYGGKRALGPVSFEINDGETVGFLGLNGAGKTTALRILACDLRPSAGTIEVGGVDAVADPHEVRKRIGFLPENPPLYADMIVTDYLRFAGEHDLAGSQSEIRQITVTVRPPSADDPKGQIKKVLGAVDGVKSVADPYEQGGGLSFALSTTKDCRAEVSRAVVEAKFDLIKL